MCRCLLEALGKFIKKSGRYSKLDEVLNFRVEEGRPLFYSKEGHC